MGVERTDYLMWGCKIDPADVDVGKHEAEICGEPGAKFDLVYDSVNGEYAVAGKILAQIEPYDYSDIIEIDQSDLAWDPETAANVREAFPSAALFAVYIFTHYH